MEKNNKLDRLEQYFQSALEQQEDLPAADFWEQVEPLIPPPEKKKRRVFFLLFGVLVAVGLVSTLLYSLNARIDAVEKEVVELKNIDSQGVISDSDDNDNTKIKSISMTKDQRIIATREEKIIPTIEKFNESATPLGRSHQRKNVIPKQTTMVYQIISIAPENDLASIREKVSTIENINSIEKITIQLRKLPKLSLVPIQWSKVELKQSEYDFSLPPVLLKKKRRNEFFVSAAVSALTIGTQLVNDPIRPINSVGSIQYHPTFSLRVGTILKSRWVLELGGEYKRYYDNVRSQNQHTFRVMDAIQFPDGLQGKYTFNLSQNEEDVRVGLTLFQPNGSSTARLEDGDVFNTTISLRQQIELSRIYLSIGYKFNLNHRFQLIPKIGTGTILFNNFNAQISQVNVQNDALIPQSFTIVSGQSRRGILSSWQLSLDALYRWKPRWSFQANATQRIGFQSLTNYQFERANGFFDLNIGLRYHF